MATPEFVVADITALKAIDMSTYADSLPIYVTGKKAWYDYDPSDTNTGNDEWIVEPTGGNGNGAWHPIGPIFGSTTPTGASAHPVAYYHIDVACTPDEVDRLYANPGGGSTTWTSQTMT